MAVQPRRALLQKAIVAILTMIAALIGGRRRAHAGEQALDSPGEARKWGMAIDLDRCTGCGGCVVACRVENNVPVTGPAEQSRGTGIYWMDMLPLGESSADSTAAATAAPAMMPVPCMQCDNAPCVKVCPVGATYQTAEGIVAQIYDRCIGCRFCQVACPYGRRYFNWTDPVWPESHIQYLNPDVSIRPSGTVEKCNFCHHRIRNVAEIAKLEGRAIADEEVRRLPACAQACPASAITFGDLADTSSEIARLSASPRASRLLEHLGTEPRVWYLARDRSS